MNILKRLSIWGLAVVLLMAMALPVMATYEDEELPEGVVFDEADEIVYATGMVNVRKGPGVEYEIIAVLNYGEAIRRIGVGSNDWSRVLYRGEEAYMHSSLISTERPSNFGGSTLDDSALKQQLGLVNGLNRLDYTTESWAQVDAAIAEAELALTYQNQIMADEALKKLKEAVGSLVKVDFSELNRALLAVEEFSETDAYSGLWVTLSAAVQQGREALTGGDQAVVDAATQQILTVLNQMKDMDAQREAPEVVVQEVPVEVPPTDEFCNIPKHRVWPVVACVSIAVNVLLLMLIGAYVFKKGKTQRDDTPLVDYDIDDDTF